MSVVKKKEKPSNRLHKKATLLKKLDESTTYIEIGSDINLSEHILERPYKDSNLEQETRSKIALWLVKMLGFSFAVTIPLMSLTAFVPQVDKNYIKDLNQTLILPQVTLVAMALGYYFGVKKEDKQ